MRIEVQDLPPEQWAVLAEDAHKVVFSERRPWDMNRIDFALLVIDADTRIPLGYCTVKEINRESVYWQYGGAFPSAARSIKAYRFHEELVRWTKERYARISMLVEAGNVRYLKLAMHFGFRIIGVRVFEGTVLCELLLEFKT